MSTKFVILTRVLQDGDKVRLRSTIFAINGRYEEKFRRRKTLAADNWELKSYRWHQDMVHEVQEIATERAMILRS